MFTWHQVSGRVRDVGGLRNYSGHIDGGIEVVSGIAAIIERAALRRREVDKGCDKS